MENVLWAVQISNLLLLLTTITYGIMNLRNMKENKILIVVPILSLLQLIISEFASIYFYEENKVSNISKASVDIYSGLEFLIIILYYNKIAGYDNLIKINKTLLIAIIIFYCFWIYQPVDSQNILTDYFVLFGGLWIEGILLVYFIKELKNNKIYFLISDPNNIACAGIFLSYIIIWPVNVLQNLYIQYLSSFFSFLFLSNSLGYFILFTFLITSFHASRKSRNS
jgi:hypothetical protein